MSNAARKQLGIQPEMLRNSDKHKVLPSHDLHAGQSFMCQDNVTKQWHPAFITNLCQEKRGHMTTTSDGVVYRKMQAHDKLYKPQNKKSQAVQYNQWHNQIIYGQWNNQWHNLTTRSLHKWRINHKYLQADLKWTLIPSQAWFISTSCILCAYGYTCCVYKCVRLTMQKIQANASLMYTCLYKLICNHPLTMRKTIWLDLVMLCNVKLKQANYKQIVMFVIHI